MTYSDIQKFHIKINEKNVCTTECKSDIEKWSTYWFNKYLLITYYVPGTILNEAIVIKMATQIPNLMELLHCNGGNGTIGTSLKFLNILS